MCRHLPGRHLCAAFVAMASSALTAVGFAIGAPAAAAPAPAPAPANAGTSGAMTHPGRDFMGSTIAAHEGRQAVTAQPRLAATTARGNDVSHWQGSINWKNVYANGARFSYAKATEGTTYRDPNFSANYAGAYKAGFIRGAYHFALPNRSSGATQANYFVAHGGGWSKDGKTLPGTLDIEYNPYGATCYGKSKTSMRSWIASFLNQYHQKTGRWAVIYTTTDWWKSCTGNYGGFARHDPLWIARYASSAGTLPSGWGVYTFWQRADHGRFPGDQDVFNGSLSRLKVLATG
jgi:GH25 family lysozyme M1 (1,4-beta-N-acetylmuramidase)